MCSQSGSEGFLVCENKHHPNKSRKEPSSRLDVLKNACFSWLQTCSHSPGGPGCIGAAPCPGAPGGPAACAVRRVSHGPGLGWSDAGGTDLHPWVPHTGDSTLSHQHTATSSTKQSQGRHGTADRPKRGEASRMRTGITVTRRTKQDWTEWDRTLWKRHCASFTVQILNVLL